MVPHTSLTAHAPGGVVGSKCRTSRFFHTLTLLPPGTSMFHKHMSSLNLDLYAFIRVCHGAISTLGKLSR